VAGARALLQDPDPGVRATALGALGRLGQAD
jgi:HEAT repeat protein